MTKPFKIDRKNLHIAAAFAVLALILSITSIILSIISLCGGAA